MISFVKLNIKIMMSECIQKCSKNNCVLEEVLAELDTSLEKIRRNLWSESHG